MLEKRLDGRRLAEKLGDRHRCPRAVVDMLVIQDYGGLGQRSLSPSFLLGIYD
jgi:hypothetical protein